MKNIFCIAVVFSLTMSGCNKQTAATGKLDENLVKVGVAVLDWPKKIPANTSFKVKALIANAGQITIPALGKPDGSMKVGVTYHWRASDERIVVWDGFITALPTDLKPNKQKELDVTVWAPPLAGRYTLEMDLVQSGAFWFAGAGSQTARIVIDVQ